MQGWKSKTLSWAGRVTFIKSVALPTPIYDMSTFKFPKSLCKELDVIVRKFWWSPKKDGNRFYTPMAWVNLCKPRSIEGVRFQIL